MENDSDTGGGGSGNRKCDVCTVSSSVMLHPDALADDTQRQDMVVSNEVVVEDPCPDIIADMYVASTQAYLESPQPHSDSSGTEHPRLEPETVEVPMTGGTEEVIIECTYDNMRYNTMNMSGLNVLCEAVYSAENMGSFDAYSVPSSQDNLTMTPNLTAIVREKLKDICPSPHSPAASGYESGDASLSSPDSVAPRPKSYAPGCITSVLPPCRVCGEKASGLHYGVNTCEACKGFFRRSLKRKVEYKCMGKGDECAIEPGRRNVCPKCRYKKCLSVGMSKEAIKTGRYTHEKRTRDIKEVQRIKRGESVQEDPLPIFSCENFNEKEMDAVIRSLEIAQREMYGVMWPIFLDKEGIEGRIKKYNEKLKTEEELFGPMKSISKEEHKEFYESTGIDLDNRLEMMSNFATMMEHGITRYIGYAKRIPGFSDLCLDDQALLVKNARFEFWFFGFCRFIDPDLKIACNPKGECYHISELFNLWDADFIKHLFHFSRSVKKIDLKPAELALIRSIILSSRDGCQLKEPEKVELIQWKMILCLKHYLTKSRPNEVSAFCKIFDRLIAVRELKEMNEKIARNLKLDWPVIKNHPLLLELLSI